MAERLTVTFTAMAHGGEALARDEGGRVIFVPYAIPGETALIEILETRRGFARGRIVELVDAAPVRVTPRCPHFSPAYLAKKAPFAAEPVEGVVDPAHGCGGCQWQHIGYEAQVDFKTQIVREQFARVGKIPDAPVLPMIAAKNPWNYRNHMQFVVNEEGKLCLQRLESHQFVPIQVCYIMDEPITAMFKTLELDPESFEAVTLRAGENTGEQFLILESEDPETPEIETDEPISIAFRTEEATVPILGNTALTEQVGARSFRISPDSFFQVNTAMAETLLALVSEALAPRPEDVLLDAYGGVGLFGLSLAARVKQVIEIEENPAALADAQRNAADAGLENVAFQEGSVEEVLPRFKGKIDLAVIDPPRAGMEPVALDALAAHLPRMIVYVSCDPATLARDAARLAEKGYRLTKVQPLDLFPQTFHIESVAVFQRG